MKGVPLLDRAHAMRIEDGPRMVPGPQTAQTWLLWTLEEVAGVGEMVRSSKKFLFRIQHQFCLDVCVQQAYFQHHWLPEEILKIYAKK